MPAAIGTILALLAVAALLCAGAFLALGGAVVAATAGPADRSRGMGAAASAFGFALFVLATLAALGAAPRL